MRRRLLMVSTVELRIAARSLRAFATAIKRNNEAAQNPTAGLDAGPLEKAPKIMEEAAAKIEQLRRP
jgi:hypothetical protein